MAITDFRLRPTAEVRREYRSALRNGSGSSVVSIGDTRDTQPTAETSAEWRAIQLAGVETT